LLKEWWRCCCVYSAALPVALAGNIDRWTVVPIVLCCVTTDGASIQTEPVVRVLQPTLSPAAAAHPSIRSYLLTVRTYNISQYRAGHHSSISSYVGTLFNGASSKSSARRGTRSALLRSHLPASHLPKPASQPASQPACSRPTLNPPAARLRDCSIKSPD